MFLFLLAASIVWVALFIASAAFDVWFEITRPSFFLTNPVGRVLTVIGIAPFLLTIGLTALASLPFVAVFVFFADPWDQNDLWEDTMVTVGAVFEWFTSWAPEFVTTGRE